MINSDYVLTFHGFAFAHIYLFLPRHRGLETRIGTLQTPTAFIRTSINVGRNVVAHTMSDQGYPFCQGNLQVSLSKIALKNC